MTFPSNVKKGYSYEIIVNDNKLLLDYNLIKIN
jgi:hypothetical protein